MSETSSPQKREEEAKVESEEKESGEQLEKSNGKENVVEEVSGGEEVEVESCQTSRSPVVEDHHKRNKEGRPYQRDYWMEHHQQRVGAV